MKLIAVMLVLGLVFMGLGVALRFSIFTVEAQSDPPCTAETLRPSIQLEPINDMPTSGLPTLKWGFPADCTPAGFALFLNDQPGDAGLRAVSGTENEWTSETQLVCNQIYVWGVLTFSEDGSTRYAGSSTFVPVTECVPPAIAQTPATTPPPVDPANLPSVQAANGMILGMADHPPNLDDSDAANVAANSPGVLENYVANVLMVSMAINNQTSSGAYVPPVNSAIASSVTPDDSDGDTVPDMLDMCPVDFGANFTGCPDTDGDNVIDIQDRCPDVAGSELNMGCEFQDYDGDGMGDWADICVDVPGPIEFLGCPQDHSDSDGDGWQNYADPCPTEAGTANGCPDSDADGFADFLDACPFEAGFAGGEGCPWIDTDGDGIEDTYDSCPADWGDDMGCPDTDGDGIADVWDVCPDVPADSPSGCPDSDGDGVFDENDACPNSVGIKALAGCASGGTITMQGVPPVSLPHASDIPLVDSTEGIIFKPTCMPLNVYPLLGEGAGGTLEILTKPNCENGEYQSGTVVQVRARPDTGSYVQAFEICGRDVSPPETSFTVPMKTEETSSCSVRAHFVTDLCYIINTSTLGNVGSGMISVSPSPNCPINSTKYARGTPVEITASVDDGNFSNWETDCAVSSIETDPHRLSVVANDDCSAKARFVDEGDLVCHDVNVNIDNAGGSGQIEIIPPPNPDCGDGAYSHGTNVIFKVHVDSGSRLDEWSVCGQSTNMVMAQHTLTGDCTVDARFIGASAEGLPDGDEDGVPDAWDMCPELPADDSTGCPDTDGDGVDDSADKCPNTPGSPGMLGCSTGNTIAANTLPSIDQSQTLDVSAPGTLIGDGIQLDCVELATSWWATGNGAGGDMNILTPPNCGENSYQIGTAIDVQAVPDPGSVLVNMSLCGETVYQPSATLTAMRDCTVSATFAETQCYHLNLSSESDGGTGRIFTDTAPNCPYSSNLYRANTVLNIYARTDTGVFNNWSTDCGVLVHEMQGDRSDVLAISTGYRDCSVTARFTDELYCHEVAIELSGPGQIAADPPPNCGDNAYTDGTTVVFRVESGEESELESWSVCGESPALVLHQYTITDDCTVEARFVGEDSDPSAAPPADCNSCHASPGDDPINAMVASLPPGSILFNGETTDSDGDSVLDTDDLCPDQPGLRVLFGCPMAITHIANKPPIQVAGYSSQAAPYAQSGFYTDPFADVDRDGVPNGLDNCPTTVGEFASYGCPLNADAEQCVVRTTRANVETRVGPGFHRAIFSDLPPDQDIPVIGFATANDGSMWWQIDKAAVPGSEAANTLWVNQADVAMTGACGLVLEADVPPIILPEPTAVPTAAPAPMSVQPNNTNNNPPPAANNEPPPVNDNGDDPPLPPPAPVCYSVGVSSQDNGGGTWPVSIVTAPNCAGGKYKAGTTVTFQASAPGGIQVDWIGSCGDSGSGNSTTATINSNCTAVARFTAN